MSRLETFLPHQASRDRVKNGDIPALEKQIKVAESEIPSASEQSEQVRKMWSSPTGYGVRSSMGITTACQAAQKVNDIKKDIRDIATLKQHAAAITKNQSEIGRLTTEIANLEDELSSTGSSKTADDVQTELDALSNEM